MHHDDNGMAIDDLTDLIFHMYDQPIQQIFNTSQEIMQDLVIFLVDGHFTCMIYIDGDIYYFDPLGQNYDKFL